MESMLAKPGSIWIDYVTACVKVVKVHKWNLNFKIMEQGVHFIFAPILLEYVNVGLFD